jgi:hypothetical protein
MQFLAQLPTSEADIPEIAARNQTLLLFHCQNHPGVCYEWEADEGGNAAVLVPVDGRQPLAAPPGDTLLPEQTGMAFEAWVQPTDPSEAFEAYLDTLLEKRGQMLGKMGGEPVWLQFDQTPKCACGQAMLLVAQIEDFDFNINFGGGGDGYAFACPACPTSAKFLWQC